MPNLKNAGEHVRLTALILLSLVLAFFAVAIGVTSSSTNGISSQSQFNRDSRFTGISPNGWTTPDFSFVDSRISAWSARPIVQFEPRKQAGSDAGRFLFLINGEVVSLREFRGLKALDVREKDPALESLIQNAKLEAVKPKSGIRVEAQALNPFQSEDGRQLNLRILSFNLIPRKLLLVPSLEFGLIPTLCAASLLFFFTVSGSLSSIFTYLRLLIGFAALVWLFCQNSINVWDNAYWLWLLCMCLLVGATLWRLYLKNIPAPVEATSGLLPAIICTVVALAIRLPGVGFGLPNLFHPDEGRKVTIARNMVINGDLNPHYFRHPSFMLYSTAGLGKIQQLVTGKIPELDQMTRLGRSVSATLGALSVLIIFLIGRILYGSLAGLIACALMTIAPLAVVSSRYIKEDSCMLFFTLLALYCALKALQSAKIHWYLLAGLIGGFSASVKYSGLLTLVLVGIPGMAAVWVLLEARLPLLKRLQFKFPREFNQKVAGAFILFSPLVILLFALGFLIITPYSVLDTAAFMKDFEGEGAHIGRGHNAAIAPMFYYWTFHLGRSLADGLRYIPTLLCLVACGLLIVRRKTEDLIVLAALLLFYLPAEWVPAKPEPQPDRYVLPCLPFLALAVGSFISQVKACQQRYFIPLLILLLLPAISFTLKHSISLGNDTRLQASQWIKVNIPENSMILLDWKYYGPPINRDRYQVLEMKRSKQTIKNPTVENIRAAGVKYVVLSSFTYERFFKEFYGGNPSRLNFENIFRNFPAIKEFSSPGLKYGFHNPDIKILAVR